MRAIAHPHPVRPSARLASMAVVFGLALFALAALAVRPDPHAILWNTTPSEPIGLYLRAAVAPSPGRLVAFPAPPTAYPYADRHLGYLRRTPLLKTVAAGPGDEVCTTSDVARVNGRILGPIAEIDREGRALPHWRACRRLVRGELFALANRVPNSFDSRYFGPVPETSVIGVYRPLLLLKDRP